MTKIQMQSPEEPIKIAGYAWRDEKGILRDPVVFFRELTIAETRDITEKCREVYGAVGELIRLEEDQAFRLWKIHQGMDALKGEIEGLPQ